MIMSLRGRSNVVIASVFLLAPLAASAMEPMSDAEMGSTLGQEGILLSLDFYLNSEKTSSSATSGRPVPGVCTNLLTCRFTWQIEGRDGSRPYGGLASPAGEWLVYKQGYASLSVNKLSLDASFLGGAVSAGPTYESFFTPARFQNAQGQCLVEGGCTVSNLRLMPALRTAYPGTSGSFSGGVSTGYNDVRFGLLVTGLAVEYDGAGLAGYQREVNGSFAGLRIADNNNVHQAGIAFGGSFYLYGF